MNERSTTTQIPGSLSRRCWRTGIWAVACVWAAARPAVGFWGDGHSILTQAAILALPETVPAFFRDGAETVAHLSLDPDVAKNRGAPHLYRAEFPEHFFDLELLGGEPFPEHRSEFVALCNRIDVAPHEVGFAPYAIAEYTERLTVAFAEYRRWPEKAVIRAKCLVYAGFLAHYAEDLVQPLHATIHYDGRVGADGSKTGAGIHEQVDAMVERLRIDPEVLARKVTVTPVEGELFPVIRTQVLESNGRVDRVYELAADLDPLSAEGRAFAEERARRAVAFTGSLFLTAWDRSEEIALPGWLRR